MRRFTRTPYYSGPDDPAIGEVRGTLALSETVVIETIGGADNDFEAAGETRAGMITSGESHRRYARPGVPFTPRCGSAPARGPVARACRPGSRHSRSAPSFAWPP